MKAIKIGAVIFCCAGVMWSEPVVLQEGAAFHKMKIDPNASKDDPACMQCHVHTMKTDPASDPARWSKPREIDVAIADMDESGGKADPFSIGCLSCHDGNIGSVVMNAPISPCGLKSKAPVTDKGKNHPVFMPYDGSRKELHPPHSVLKGEWEGAKRVNDLLRDEKVVCMSCHVPHHSSESGYLRTSQKNSALCIGCHNK